MKERVKKCIGISHAPNISFISGHVQVSDF